MANIQQSVNSALTTSAALKALGEKREVRKKEEELLNQKLTHEKEIAQNRKYIDALQGKATIPELAQSVRNVANYNVNEEFAIAEESARNFLNESNGSLESFMAEYEDRRLKGGSK